MGSVTSSLQRFFERYVQVSSQWSIVQKMRAELGARTVVFSAGVIVLREHVERLRRDEMRFPVGLSR
jgi:hypothetical protein